MNEYHVVQCEEESRYRSRVYGESQFAADEIEYNNAHRSYDYREEPPIESVVGENINGGLRIVPGDRRTARAALYRDSVY